MALSVALCIAVIRAPCSEANESRIPLYNCVRNDFGIKVYPQPAKNSFKIDIPAELINAQISLMDATGRVVTKTLADKKVTEIITTELPIGLYMLMVTKNENQFNGKVIISR